jgi:hypothetical protein
VIVINDLSQKISVSSRALLLLFYLFGNYFHNNYIYIILA